MSSFVAGDFVNNKTSMIPVWGGRRGIHMLEQHDKSAKEGGNFLNVIIK